MILAGSSDCSQPAPGLSVNQRQKLLSLLLGLLFSCLKYYASGWLGVQEQAEIRPRTFLQILSLSIAIEHLKNLGVLKKLSISTNYMYAIILSRFIQIELQQSYAYKSQQNRFTRIASYSATGEFNII